MAAGRDPTLPSVSGADRFSEEQATYAVKGVDAPDLDQGIAVLKQQLKLLPASPGVYRMLNAAGDVLYVGKARALKQRVVAYTQPARLPYRLQRMVAQTRSLTVVTTASEAEALLLEANLIKRFRPPYNVLLRDDKSFPYIYLREDHAFAQVRKHRGAKPGKGVLYGPFASAQSVNRTLNALQRVFLLRSCSDSTFENRSRPCLLFQIKRCSAPCVARIDPDSYGDLVREAKDFLAGKSQQAQQQLADRMEAAAAELDFEQAAVLRDRLKALSYIQAEQGVNAPGAGDADIVALAAKGGVTCIQMFFLRAGQNWGNRAFFPRHDKAEDLDAVLIAFLSQFYEDKPAPRRILLDRPMAEAELLGEALSVRAGSKVRVETPQRGQLMGLMETARRNAAEALDRKLADAASQSAQLTAIADAFELDGPPRRIEVYDNSHIQGTNMIGAMIVGGPEGFIKAGYRKFNIRSADLEPGDDFGMMREVLGRRFKRLAEEDPDRQGTSVIGGAWPDLVLIDGGRGQLNAALAVMAELGIDDVAVVGVAKGPDRNAGREVFHLTDGREIMLPGNSPALFALQRLRDEAHRFAIGTHRAKRAKAMVSSPLDDVPGIGSARKRALLRHFGSARAVADASIDDLTKVEGVSGAMARAIHEHFRPAQ
jgi:excinuclease ABC subunit C